MGGVLQPQFCRIERWRGYVASSFFVRLPDGRLFESRRFRWHRSEPPPSNLGRARLAYDELVTRILAAGWQRHADGDPWYATEFTRLIEVWEPEVLEPEPVRPRPVVVAPPIVEPRPAPAAPPPQQEPRRFMAATLVGAAVVVTAAVVAVVVHRGVGGGHAAQPTVAAPRHSARNLATKQIQSARVQRVADLRITASGTGSWVELRRGSATGALLYGATLEAGHSVHFRAPRIWARFGAASNLAITANGRRVDAQGTFDKVFVPSR